MFLLIVSVLSYSCSHQTMTSSNRKIIDKSYDEKPEWLMKQDDFWKNEDKLNFKFTYTISGEQRTNACFELARLGINELILSELKSEIKAQNNLASEGLSENESEFLNKSLTENLSGEIHGLRIKSKAFERYIVGEKERIDCSILTEMSSLDYNKIKSKALSNNYSIKQEVADTIREKQKDFFESSK